jgi:hypothetical protein
MLVYPIPKTKPSDQRELPDVEPNRISWPFFPSSTLVTLFFKLLRVVDAVL